MWTARSEAIRSAPAAPITQNSPTLVVVQFPPGERSPRRLRRCRRLAGALDLLSARRRHAGALDPLSASRRPPPPPPPPPVLFCSSVLSSLPTYLMADVLVNFSLLRPAQPRLLLAGLNPRRLNLSRRLRLLTASVPSTRRSSFKVHAAVAESNEKKWWEKNAGPNMIDIHSIQEFIDALSQAGDRLVIAEFYGTWCGSCRALFPKLCRIAEEHPDILFVKVNFDENKPMCKRLNVRVLPFFHFYRGADGLLESFSCSLAKFQRLKDAITTHNTARCSIGPPRGVGDLELLESSTPQEKSPESSPASSNLNR